MLNKKNAPRKRDESGIKLIRKANELVEARYKFDIWEMRVFAKMLTLIRYDDKDLKRYDLPIGELLRDFNLHDKGENYQAIKEAAKRLLTRVIEIERDTPDGVQWFATSLLVGAEGFKNRSDGNSIRVQFHPDLKPYLLELKERYLVYDIRNLWGLSSVYSVRMYELLKQYERIGKRRFWVDDLRLILGIGENEYPLYANFKQKVILKAQKDLEIATDITFDLEEEKSGKKITAVTFRISSNSARRNAPALPENIQKQEEARQKAEALNGPFFNEAFEQVKPWGVAETTLRALMVEHDEQRIRESIACTLENLREGKIRENAGGFFVKAVEEGWQSKQKTKRAQAETRKQKTRETLAKTAEELKKWEQKLAELLDGRRGEVNQIIRSMSQEDPLIASEAVSNIVSNSLTRRLLENATGLELDKLDLGEWRTNKQLRDAVLREIEKLHPERFAEVQGRFDEHVKTARRNVESLKNSLSN